MIGFDFLYCRPDSVEEACRAYRDAEGKGQRPFYYAGGTEIVTLARDGKLRPGAVIDLKRIPECRVMGQEGGELRFGCCLTLNELTESSLFPLLGLAAAGVADHSVRNSITLGGNVAGMLPYREAVLPFLAAGATARIAGPEGGRSAPLQELFSKRLKLRTGEFLLSLSVSRQAATAPFFYRRRERQSPVDYPLLTAVFLVVGNRTQVALSGAHGYPLKAEEAEAVLGDPVLAPEGRAERAVSAISAPLRTDMRASAEYRRELLVQVFREALERLGGKR
jgi:CO/xanthine dehydrogenase FAD-binding subunit